MKFLKNNLLVIIIFSFLTSFLVYKVLDYKQEYESYIQMKENTYLKECKKLDELDEKEKRTCNIYRKELDNEKNMEFYTTLSNIVGNDFKFIGLDFLACLILIIPSFLMVNQVLKDQVLINILTREKYGTFLRKLFLKVYRYIWLFPTLLLLFIILILSFTKVDLNAKFLYSTIALTSKPIIFLGCYLLNSLLLSGIYLNISLISLRFKHNYFVCCLTSLIIYIGIILFFEIGIDYVFFQNTLNKLELLDLFKITGIFNFNISESISPIIRVLISLMVYILSMILIYFCYKNKEKLVIACEKNSKEEI